MLFSGQTFRSSFPVNFRGQILYVGCPLRGPKNKNGQKVVREWFWAFPNDMPKEWSKSAQKAEPNVAKVPRFRAKGRQPGSTVQFASTRSDMVRQGSIWFDKGRLLDNHPEIKLSGPTKLRPIKRANQAGQLSRPIKRTNFPGQFRGLFPASFRHGLAIFRQSSGLIRNGIPSVTVLDQLSGLGPNPTQALARLVGPLNWPA